MTKDEALELALEALGDIASARSRGFGIDYVEGYVSTTIKQLRQALAEWKPDDTAYRPDGLSQDSDQLPDATKMIDKDFALNVALETLYNFADDESVDGWKAIDAIGVARKALSEPPVKSYCGGKPNYCEPELVGYVYQNELQGMTLGAYSCTEIYPDDSTGRIPLYTAPPKREWVSLTDDDMEAMFLNEDGVRIARYIESKLKEKNNG